MSDARCCKSLKNSALAQNLDEMEFERGIWSAASDGDLAKVRKFLSRGVNPDVLDAAGYTALHYAASKDHIEICEILLKHGASIDAVTRAGMASSLHRAATKGKIKTIQLLINMGANVALKDADGRTALHRAVLNGHSEISELLLRQYPKLASIADKKNKLPTDYGQN